MVFSSGELCAVILQGWHSLFRPVSFDVSGGMRMADDNPCRPDGGPGETVPEETPATGGVTRRGFLKGAGVVVSVPAILGEGFLEAAGATGAKVSGPGPVSITLRINGQSQKLELEPRVTLLDALRNHLDLTGAKKVCDRAVCGTCTMLLDGKAVYSCNVLAIDAEGRDVQTIEGLAPAGALHPVSAAFIEHDAQQCGFCTPGFVMAAKAFLDRNPNPTYEQVTAGLGGNLCRCGTYMGVREAVLDAAGRLRGGRA
jgi:xanthine dehydrogenase YagT iron-sulfur-binding subunit